MTPKLSSSKNIMTPVHIINMNAAVTSGVAQFRTVGNLNIFISDISKALLDDNV
jgi:hypothetical protein